ncbi:MAG: hypothetical protein LBH17_02835 [Oscillospiraceae bacterium]|jgi:hypothetical protein|nr:hypothetical protein [Oscillospiraceae bacterium]
MKKLNIVATALISAAILLLVILTAHRLISGAPTDASPTADTPTATPTATPTGDAPVNTPNGTDGLETPDESAPITLPPIEGERFTVEAPYAHERISITVDTASYTRELMENGDMYYATVDPSRSVLIEIVFVADSISERKASFLDSYLPGYSNMTDLGEVLVASSPVVGVGLTVTDGAATFDAWLIEVENGFFAVVAGYRTLEQGGELYRMLDTLTFEG